MIQQKPNPLCVRKIQAVQRQLQLHPGDPTLLRALALLQSKCSVPPIRSFHGLGRPRGDRGARVRLGAFQMRRRPLRLGDTCTIDPVTGGRVCTAPQAGGSGGSTGVGSGSCGTRIVCSGGVTSAGGKNPGFCQRMVIPCTEGGGGVGPSVSTLPGGVTAPQVVPVQLQFQTPNTVSVPTSYSATQSASGPTVAATGIDLTSGISDWLAGTTLGLSNKYVALGGVGLALLYFGKRR